MSLWKAKNVMGQLRNLTLWTPRVRGKMMSWTFVRRVFHRPLRVPSTGRAHDSPCRPRGHRARPRSGSARPRRESATPSANQTRCAAIEPKLAEGYRDEAARKGVFFIRARLKPRIARETIHRRGEMVERSFAPVLDRGSMRRAWLRGRENIHKLHVAGFNLGVLMRAMHGQGTPREAATAFIFVLQTDAALAFGPIAVNDGEIAALVVIAAAPTSS
jgi:hypothetical protein